MTYEEARKFIDEANRYGLVPGLETITELLRRLGNPQEKLKVIHVAGTNGKGSVIAFISSILTAAGYRVGRYISPSVFSYREKVQISELGKDVEYITEQGVCDTIELVRKACEAMVSEGFAHPTCFESETAMAMLYLSWTDVDFALIEVGLGGRLDATNVIRKPVCSVITSISMDHMHILGDTLEKIAQEKAGIIKPDSPAVTCSQKPEVIEVIRKTCSHQRSELTIADINMVTEVKHDAEGITFRLKQEHGEQDYCIRMLGEYQVGNANLAIQAVKVIEKQGYRVGIEAIRQGLYRATWHGRFEVILRKPYLVLDGAHNEDAARMLRASIELYFKNRRLIYIMGVLADKDYGNILKLTAPLADRIITLTPRNSRALPSSVLAKEAEKYCIHVKDAGTVENAMALALKKAGKEDVIIAFGSFSFLGDLMQVMRERKDD